MVWTVNCLFIPGAGLTYCRFVETSGRNFLFGRRRSESGGSGYLSSFKLRGPEGKGGSHVSPRPRVVRVLEEADFKVS